MKENKLLTTKEVREYLRVGREKCYSIFNQPDFPKIVLGREFYVFEKDLIDWLKSHIGTTVIL